VRLYFTRSEAQLAFPSLPFPQLEQCLAQNSALTSLQLSSDGNPWHVFNLDCLFQSLTGLQSLELMSRVRSIDACDLQTPSSELPSHPPCDPRGIAKLSSITRLCLGPGFHLQDLSQILPYMIRLQS
jgi:hypothetical protein